MDLKTAERRSDKNLIIYGSLVAGVVVLGFVRGFFFFKVAVNASRHLHTGMLSAVLASPVHFFDVNPIGRILNRFAKVGEVCWFC